MSDRNTTNGFSTCARVVVLSALALVLGACAPYTLKGRVVRGEASYIAVVDDGDPRLDAEGIPGVQLKLTLDPGKLKRKTAAQEVSGASGELSLPVEEAGAGLLEFDAGLIARKRGYAPAEGFFRLPGGGKRILVVLTPGRDDESASGPETGDDLMRQYERFR